MHHFSRVSDQNTARTAISDPFGVVTYTTLQQHATSISAGLADDGAGPGRVVGLWMPAGRDYVAALLGVAGAGATFLPLAMDTPTRRLAHILTTGDPALILTTAAHEDAARHALAAAGSEVPLRSIDTLSPGQTTPIDPDPHQPGYLLFTSGSTGQPKAVAGRSAGLLQFINWEIREFNIGAACRVSWLAAPTFDVSLRDILVPLLAGGTLCIPDADTRLHPQRLVSWLRDEGVTQVHCVPSLFRLLIGELETRGHATFPALQRILLAGEPLYADDVRRWRAVVGTTVELVNLYGPTETTLAKAFYRIEKLPDTATGIIPLGRPIDDAELLIIRDGAPCDAGVIGEIYIRTPFRSHGYYRDPALTAAAFIPNPLTHDPNDIVYRTGDQGRLRDAQTVEFIGRLDHQVKLNGIRIELGEVEAHLRRHVQVTAAVAVIRNDNGTGDRLAAYFTAAVPLTPDALREHLSAYLPDAMQPTLFVQMEALPLNLHGKVDRKALPPPTALLYADDAFVAPQGETETRLATVWSALLGSEQVAADRTFVELGGDSLKAIRAVGEIYKAFGVEASLRVLFEQGTIQKLAAWIDAQG
ncbi:MAG: non-ribosomal peptide synthetase [Verrucomicrobia bacterium]|jgi:amino acid adenylation domain-containing protein|nr:non-ribosomal peptide synthetase [Verrucomicrobiota bacterium]MBT7067415.1 non-ribosomal peptide synthetase [Verrucomicrobiota bacterium]MBT7700063.1 non-ribosomal peptide synthetase [Verrucomicrobiota bacterium]